MAGDSIRVAEAALRRWVIALLATFQVPQEDAALADRVANGIPLHVKVVEALRRLGAEQEVPFPV